MASRSPYIEYVGLVGMNSQPNIFKSPSSLLIVRLMLRGYQSQALKYAHTVKMMAGNLCNFKG